MSSVVSAILATMKTAGIAVEVHRDGSTIMVTARDSDGQVYVVRADDEYAAVCEAAEQCGIDLSDG